MIYPGKNLLELADAERGLEGEEWRGRAERHEKSFRLACEELARRGSTKVATEGGATFEDGAVTCTSLQLGLYALRAGDPETRREFARLAADVLEAHRCLTRLNDPDCRSNGATLRFWELWGDIRGQGQAMLSPHGWSAWRIYAEYYLYLLTGKPEYLRMTINAMGSCTQLVNWPDGKFHCAYLPEPNVMLKIREPDGTVHGKLVRRAYGEQYLSSIMSWFGQNTKGTNYLDRVGWNWGGQPEYEIIKAMEEIAIPNAFVCEMEDGSILTWNCRVEKTLFDTWVVTPSEDVVRSVHCNSRNARSVSVKFSGSTVKQKCAKGMAWIHQGRRRKHSMARELNCYPHTIYSKI